MKSEEWSVYLLECSDMSLYCGIARDALKRLSQHNGKLPGGARYTRSRRPVTLLGTIICESKSEALKMEAAIKAMPRKSRLAIFQAEENAGA